jgi:hypothetical protein
MGSIGNILKHTLCHFKRSEKSFIKVSQDFSVASFLRNNMIHNKIGHE